MKSKFYLFISFFLIVIVNLFGGCKDIKPSSPDVKIDTASFRKPSIISIPLQINLQPAFDLAENQFPKSIGAPKWNESFGTNGADDCGHGVSCEYNVTRAPLNFTMAGDVLTTNLSFVYSLNCRFRPPVVCNLMSAGCSPSAAHGSWSTQISIDNQWNSNVHTSNNGVTADDRCRVGPAGGIVDITTKVMGGFNKAFDKVGQTVDTKITENLNSKQRVSEAWQKISQPFPLKDLGWFSLSPDSIKLSAFTLDNNTKTAKVNLFLKANPEIYFGKQPTVSTKPLPDNSSFIENNSLNILLPISTDYSFAENQIKKNLKIQEGGIRYPPTGRKYLKVTDVNVYGYGRKVVVKISFNGTKSGYAYLEGTPSYDTLTNELSFPDLDYSIDTKSLMLKAIDFFKHDDFIRDLRNRLTINLNGKVTQLKNKVTDALNKQYKDFTLQGNVTNFRVLGLYSDQAKNLFTAYFEVNGNLQVQIF